MLKPLGILLVLVVGLPACTIVNSNNQKTPQTQLQVRAYQTREFDTNDVKLVMKAVLNTLQDDGFVVRNAVVDLGLITATKELQLSSSRSSNDASSDDAWAEIFAKIFKTSTPNNSRKGETRFDKFKVIEASINVTELGLRTKVRANFTAKVLDNKGDPSEVYVVDDMKFYQNFFAKVDKGVFIEKQGL
ncbi:MAG: hypothetical protein J5I53_06175 [Bradyrhizobiaceae bacterium]|nr:hypothetical protein [Bradyrhizobiaceae bacterium]